MTRVESVERVPLRTAEERLSFVEAYFQAVGATLVRASDGYREFQLPRDVDKELTDRPYYWLWAEKTNQMVPPTVLRLAFLETALQRENERLRQEAEADSQKLSEIERMFFRPPTAELITIGSFRLERLYQSLEKRGQFACMQPTKIASGALVPWLMINVQVSYRCDMMEQEIVSIGVCLTNGQIVDNFYHMIRHIGLQPADPNQVLSSSLLSVATAMDRIRTYLEQKLANRPHDWAQAASSRLQQELKQVQTYYHSIAPDLSEGEKSLTKLEQNRKEQEMMQRMGPSIELVPIQIALIALFEPETYGRNT